MQIWRPVSYTHLDVYKRQFMSVGLPILLILVIQGSIWVNFAFPGITGKPIFFMSYLIVTAIQMGANIDYAIITPPGSMSSRAPCPRSRP